MIRFGAHLVLVLRHILAEDVREQFREKLWLIGDLILNTWVLSLNHLNDLSKDWQCIMSFCFLQLCHLSFHTEKGGACRYICSPTCSLLVWGAIFAHDGAQTKWQVVRVDSPCIQGLVLLCKPLITLYVNGLFKQYSCEVQNLSISLGKSAVWFWRSFERLCIKYSR